MKILCHIYFSLLLHTCCFAQSSTITGTVQNTHLVPLPGTNLTLHKKGQSIIIAFTISDKNGTYKLHYTKNDEDSLELKASVIGYGQHSLFFAPTEKKELNFTLSPQAIQLREVKIKSVPIWLKKDTINYSAAEFKQPQDRVIGDIIARLPGVEVTPGGQIKYQGKPINKYYIEGLDLLEDKYGIANNNIPADLIDKVQVLENHQPIRLLDSISFSDRASLNIKLKKEAKTRLIGQARLGIGVSPVLTENELVTMLFKKNTQLINTYKYNNTGIDNSRDLTSQNITDYINAIQNGSLKNNLLSAIEPAAPPINKNRYLFNNAHTFSANQLIPLNNIHQLRVNVSYINDYQQQRNNINSRILLPLDTIHFFEQNHTKKTTNLLQTDLTLMANSPKYYLKNLLRFQGWWQPTYGLITNNIHIKQRVRSDFFNILNDFKLIKTGKKSISEYGIYLGYVSHPQKLLIYPGLYHEALNDNTSYDAVTQIVKINTFYTDNYFLKRKRLGRFNTLLKMGVNWQEKKIESAIFTQTAGTQKSTHDSFSNNLQWSRQRVYLETIVGYENRKLKTAVTLPLNITGIQFSNIHAKPTKQNSIVFMPSLSVMFQFSPKLDWKNVFTYNNRNFGDAEQVTNGYILKTYRTFSNNNSPLPAQSVYNISSYINFRDPLKTIFFSTGLNFVYNSNNIIYEQYYNGSLETLLAQLLNNTNQTLSFFARMNKYIINWKTALTFNTNYSLGKLQQLQQGFLSTFTNKTLSSGINVNTKFNTKITADYIATGYQYTSKTVKSKLPSIFAANQQMTLNYYPVSLLGISISGEHYYLNTNSSNKQNYYFCDLNLRLKPIKARIEWELLLQNVFNTRHFVSASNMNNVNIISSYELRPRQILLKAGFRL